MVSDALILSKDEWQVVLLSVKIASLAVLVTLPFGLLAAHYLARKRGPASFILENLVQLPLVLPPVITGYFLLILFSPTGPIGRWLASALSMQITFTSTGAAIAAGVISFPLMVQTMRVVFQSVDPEWEEAALVYGGGRWEAFRFVTLPLSAKGIAAGIVIAFARALGEFGATIVIAGNLPGRTRTIPTAVFTSLNRVGGDAEVIRLVCVAAILSMASLAVHSVLTRKLHQHPSH